MEDISMITWSKIRYLRIYKSDHTKRIHNYSIFANGRVCLPVYIKIAFEDQDNKLVYPNLVSILSSLRLYSFDGNAIGSAITHSILPIAPSVDMVSQYRWMSSAVPSAFEYNENIVDTTLRLRADISELLRRKHAGITTPSSFSLSDYHDRSESGEVQIKSPTDPACTWNAAYFEEMFAYSEKFGLPSYMPSQARRTSAYENDGEHKAVTPPNILWDVQKYLRYRTQAKAANSTFDGSRWHRVDELTGDEVVLSDSSPGTCWEKDFFLGMMHYAETEGLPWYTSENSDTRGDTWLTRHSMGRRG